MPAVVTKPAGVMPLGPVDPSGIISLVNRVSEAVWAKEDSNKENNFECFHHTRHLVFRFIENNRDPRTFYSNPTWTVWERTLLPIMFQATHGYHFAAPAFPKAMFARLAAGHRVDPHTDGAGSNLLTHKIHIPLITNPQARFLVNDQEYHLEVGQAYEVNNIARHSAVNDGDIDRIHFIFEVYEAAEELHEPAEVA